jgi:hypothetical protein
VVWKPPIDPVTGEALWDEPFGPGVVHPPVEDPPTTGRGRRRRSRDGAAGAVGAAGATALHGGTMLDDPTPGAEVGAPAVSADPFVDARTDAWVGSPPPIAPGEEAGSLEPDDEPPSKNNRTVLILLVVLLLVIGAIIYVALRPSNNHTATPPLAPTPSSSPLAADTALATSVNLRLSDLPAGWIPGVTAGQVARPPVTSAAAQVGANRSLASCIGVDYPPAAGLFGGSVLPGQTDSVRSPRFQSGADPNIQMYSTTTIMGTAAGAQALAVPFANPKFASCFGQYQTALVSSAVPGATAQVQVVTLTAPAGVKAFGYVTTLTIPNQANQVIGEGFMVGGRIEMRLEPTTNGPAIPSDAFNPAYTAVVGRIAGALNN